MLQADVGGTVVEADKVAYDMEMPVKQKSKTEFLCVKKIVAAGGGAEPDSWSELGNGLFPASWHHAEDGKALGSWLEGEGQPTAGGLAEC